MQKSLIDIYIRRISSTFTFATMPDEPALFILLCAGYIVLFPLMITIGALMGAIIDYCSRKEIAPETMKDVTDKIDALNQDTMNQLIELIDLKGRDASSNSSRALATELVSSLRRVDGMLRASTAIKRRELQEIELGIDKNPGLKSAYQESYIANVRLKKTDEEKLQAYHLQNQINFSNHACAEQKKIIKDYLAAPHNTGKKTQHEICNFFLAVDKNQPTNREDNTSPRILQ